MILSKLWCYSKWWAETLRGAMVVAFSLNQPIPATKLHPRMPPMASTYGEWFRMYPWRYAFRYLPFLRFIMLVVPTTYVIAFVLVPYKYPRLKLLRTEFNERAHKSEEEYYYGYNQKKQDREYFKKHDPLRKFRPDAYDLVYGKGKQLKKREEAPKQENELPKPGN